MNTFPAMRSPIPSGAKNKKENQAWFCNVAKVLKQPIDCVCQKENKNQFENRNKNWWKSSFHLSFWNASFYHERYNYLLTTTPLIILLCMHIINDFFDFNQQTQVPERSDNHSGLALKTLGREIFKSIYSKKTPPPCGSFHSRSFSLLRSAKIQIFCRSRKD